ncbi:MAG: DUF302 domain-containing protein, partial [bacterium]
GTSFGTYSKRYITKQSTKNFDTTLNDIIAAIDRRGFKTFAVIDHAKGAASIGEDLAPTTTIIFGNPKGGTPLIQDNRKMGLDLPLRVMVWDNGSSVMVSYTNIRWLANEYEIEGRNALIVNIAETMDQIASEAVLR